MEELASVDPGSRSPHPSFSCFLVRRSCWQAVGPFDEGMWAWAGDGDYHLRMDHLGINAYAIAVPFLHEVSGTLKHALPQERHEMCKQADQDRDTFLRKYGFAIGSDAYYAAFRSPQENVYARSGRLS